MSPVSRFHLPLGQRDAAARAQADAATKWLAAIVEAQATRADLAVSVAVDGLALVDSRSVQDSAHEVRVQDGRAVACTCLAHRTRHVCPHRAYVAIRLWEIEMGADLSQVGARALLTALRNRYLDPEPARGRPWTARLDHSQQPEVRMA